MKEKIINNIGKIILLIVILIAIFMWIFISFKSMLLTIGILTLLSYINITITTLGNAFIGRDINLNYDIFWKILFSFIISICFGIYFNV